MQNKITKCFTGFRISYGAQHSLIVMLEKWKKVLHKKENMSAIFMDLSKTFASRNHDLSLAKLKAYGFLKQALSFVCFKHYVSPEEQKTKSQNQ